IYDGDYAPYPSEEMLLADMLDNFPRLRLSDAHMEVILYMWEKTARHPSKIPSLKRLRKFQESLQARFGTQTREYNSELGNVFFVNDVRTTLALDMANPQVAEQLTVYPELKPPSITNAWDTSRWLELPLDQLTPMVRVGAHDFFVNELALLVSGEFVIPYMWATYEGALSGICRKCTYNEVSHNLRARLSISSTARKSQHLSVCRPSVYRDMCTDSHSADSHENFRDAMPNPLRAKANGEELFTLFLNTWADDVSGNVSKQWNKHWNICFQNACLPGRLLFQEYFVRFFSTSQHATAPEQLAAMKEQVLSTHDAPYPCFHAGKKQACKFRIVVQSLPADNPQQSEHCSHTTGARAHLYCRRCHVTRKMPDDPDDHEGWYASHFAPGRPRTLQETRENVEYQLDLACQDALDLIEAERTSTGINDPIASEWIDRIFAKAKEVTTAAHLAPDDPSLPHTAEDLAEYLRIWLAEQPGDHMSPLLKWSGLDPHTNTPVELLHTILLGLAKYIWHAVYTAWKNDKKKEALFATRLEGTDLNGLSIESFRPRYFVQYKGALIGRQFKALTQTMVFHLHDLCTPELFTLVKACGEISAVLWEDSIKDMTRYQSDLQILINNVLDAYADVDPLRVLDKVKLHLLTHIPDDLPRFGPALRSITEIFESFNAVFRMCSVLSNHHAPSRDIALSIADMDRLKHVISGGYWMENGVPVQAAENVRRVLEDHPIIQKHLGWAPPKSAQPGMFSVPARLLSSAEFEVLEKDFALQAAYIALPKDHLWREGAHVVSNTGDICKTGAFVFFGGSDNFDDQGQPAGSSSLRIGRIMAIYVPTNTAAISPFLVVKEYRVSTERHTHFDMPVLVNMNRDLQPVLPKKIRFIVNVQHDCRSSGCGPTGTRQISQERTTSSRTVPVLEHVSNDRYIINTHAFHNAARLRKALPRGLTVPIPLKMNRAEWLSSLSARASGASVRRKEETRKKRNATNQRKKAEKEARAADALEQERQLQVEPESRGTEHNTRLGDDDDDEYIGSGSDGEWRPE
ncbi:hypothetical protein EXIGLDRAFT_628358, partial [Exidia glandulosa HHB12029]